jgi:plastocyanin
MTIREEHGAQEGPVAGRLNVVRLTRRTVSAGILAAACGAAVSVVGGRFGADAAAAPTTSDASDHCAALSAATPAAADTGVIIENFTFSPDTLTVPLGTQVTWENRDDIPHTVTSDDKTTFASSLLDTGDTFSFTFNAAGTFAYFCSVHPMMTAKVIVQS